MQRAFIISLYASTSALTHTRNPILIFPISQVRQVLQYPLDTMAQQRYETMIYEFLFAQVVRTTLR